MLRVLAEQGGYMVDVVVVFTNGNVVNFAAQEFDVDLVNTEGGRFVTKFPYKDAEGQDSAIHLKPAQVVGVFVTPGSELSPGEQSIRYTVAHSH
jgi:hypothetical protein